MEQLATILLITLVWFLSLVEFCIIKPSRLALRVLAERETDKRLSLLKEIARDRSHFLLPVQVGIQFVLVVVALWIPLQLQSKEVEPWVILSFLILVLLISLFRELLPRWMTHRDPERVLIRILPLITPLYRVLRWCTWPLIALLARINNQANRQNGMESEEEASEEEIQAYLGVGEEEGIFEEEESRLIQSALEFRSTLVREIMTPRTEIVAIDERATIGELKDLIVASKHSRIPVYRESIDQIVGIVYVRNLLSYLEAGKENHPITPLLNEALFVPETKKVSELLPDMQAGAEHMAIAISEYGAVSGLVTIEDVLEEIVGEIHDEDELQRMDLVYEGNGSYIVRGGVEIGDLEEALAVDLGDVPVSTVSGLIVSHLGKVPVAGEVLKIQDLQVEILSSDRKKINTMRVRLSPESEKVNRPAADEVKG